MFAGGTVEDIAGSAIPGFVMFTFRTFEASIAAPSLTADVEQASFFGPELLVKLDKVGRKFWYYHTIRIPGKPDGMALN